MDRTSLLYWYPKIRDLVPTPKTEWVEVDAMECIKWVDGPIPEEKLNEIYEKAREVGYPLFMRTSHFSGKHDFKDTCYVEKEEHLVRNLKNLVNLSFAVDIIGLPIDAIVFRECLELDWRFKAFMGLPIATEVRRFIKDGENYCWHFYWPEDAMSFIGNDDERAKYGDWRQHLKDMRDTSKEEADVHGNMALKVAKVLDGYWSVDFARTREGKWVLIDMATGETSYHPSSCSHLTDEEKKNMQRYEGYSEDKEPVVEHIQEKQGD